MEQYRITGMSCAACALRVEKAVRAVEGVQSCAVSLLTHSMGVEGTASEAAILAAVKNAGYGVAKQNSAEKEAAPTALTDTETPRLLARLLSSLTFLVLLMYLSMGYTMWHFPLPSFLTEHPVAIGLLELLLASCVLLINQQFFIRGFRGLIHRAPNMDTLVALGSAASYLYSLYALFAMTASDEPARYLHELYFESAAMILALITLGKLLEARAKGKTTNALRALMTLSPKTATLIRDGQELTVAIEELQAGDLFAVRPGERVPTDGIIVQGHSALDESALTGESIPVEKQLGDTVSGATLNRSGYLICEATRVGRDTTIAQIIQMVSDAAATKAPIAKLADTVSGIFVPIVMGIAAVVLAVWLILDAGIGFALGRAISVLVISCPCALGLATPVAIMVGNGMGAKHGMLFKTAAALEAAGRVEIVALDKTGTITKGEPTVTDILGDPALLPLAYSLESKSEHPLATAIVRHAEQLGTPLHEVSEFEIFPGGGLRAKHGEDTLYGGNATFIAQYAGPNAALDAQAEELAKDGKTPLFFARNDTLLGLIAVADTVRADSAEAIRALIDMGIRVVMLTGDHPATAAAVAAQAGIKEVIASVKPDGKEAIIRQLQTEGSVAMVGDGINDAPALTRADLGIAIGAGTDVALDAADLVLVKSRPSDVPAAIRLGRATLRTIRQNLFWAFLYNAICIPVAAGAFVFAGLTLSPMLGAAAMSLSSFCVVTNALRLNLCNIRSPKHDKKIKAHKIHKKEETTMTKTMIIQGMMCPHCEARVKKVLEEIQGVSQAVTSHKDKTAVVTLTSPVADAVLTKAVTDSGYEVIEIQ